MLVWAMGLPAADFLIGPLPPLVLTAARMGVAALVLLPLWLLVERGAARRAPWAHGLWIGGVLAAGAVLLVVAQARTDAVTVAVVSAAMPVVGLTIEAVTEGRRLTAAMLAGVALSLVGGLVTYGAAMGALDLGAGALAALGSITLYTLGSRWSVTVLPGLSPLGQTALTISGAALVSATVAAISLAGGGPAPDLAAMGAVEWGALAVYGLCAMALSQLLWIASIGSLGVGVGALHINAAPFYVMVFLFLLGQPWNWLQALGALIVALGVLVAQSRPPAARRALSTD